MNRMTADEIIEVVTAYKNGYEIESLDLYRPFMWLSIDQPAWDFNQFRYRAFKPKTKTKKVKFFGYIDACGWLVFVPETKPMSQHLSWKRVPSADCEHEVEE